MADAPGGPGAPQGGVQLSPLLVASPGAGGPPPQNRVSEGARHLWEEFIKLPLLMRLVILGGIVALAVIGYSRWRASRGSSTPLGLWNADTGGVVGSNAPARAAAANTDPTQPAAPASPLPPLPSDTFSNFSGSQQSNPAAPPVPGATRVQSVAARIWATQPHLVAAQPSQQPSQAQSQPASTAWQWHLSGVPAVQSVAQHLWTQQPVLVRASGGGGRYQ